MKVNVGIVNQSCVDMLIVRLISETIDLKLNRSVLEILKIGRNSTSWVHA